MLFALIGYTAYYYYRANYGDNDVFKDPGQDKNRHCWVNCMLVHSYQDFGFTPEGARMMSEGVSLGKEFTDLMRHAAEERYYMVLNHTSQEELYKRMQMYWDDSAGGMRANQQGQRYGMMNLNDWWNDCKRLCGICPMEK